MTTNENDPKASNPSGGFHVVPVDPALVDRDQHTSYDRNKGTLQSVNGFFDVGNPDGSV